METTYRPDPTTDSIFPESIETDRLELLRLSETNVSLQTLHSFFASLGDETEHMVFEPPSNLSETRDYLLEREERWETGSQATYVIRSTEDDRTDSLMGVTNLDCDWNRLVGDPGICLRRPFWGHGYSRERIRALCDVAFDHLQLEVMEVECFVDNTRAYESVESYVDHLGGEYVGIIPNAAVLDDGTRKDCHYFTIERDDLSR